MKRLPFRWKLTLLILLTSGLTLGIAFSGLYIYDAVQFRVELQSRIVNTRIVATDSLVPKLTSGAKLSDKTFEALFASEQQVVAAAVFSPEDNQLLRFIRPGSDEYIPQLKDISRVLGPQLNILLEPLRDAEGNTLGTLYIKSGLNERDKERFSNLLKGAGIVFLVSALISFAVGYRLQGAISKPITA